jgi:hypothetical protein
MRRKRYSDVISQAEVLASDPSSYTTRGVLKSRVERRINRLTNRAVFLTQFERTEELINY